MPHSSVGHLFRLLYRDTWGRFAMASFVSGLLIALPPLLLDRSTDVNTSILVMGEPGPTGPIVGVAMDTGMNGSNLTVIPDLYTAGNGEQSVYFPANLSAGCREAQIRFTADSVEFTFAQADDSQASQVAWQLIGSENVSFSLESNGLQLTLRSGISEQTEILPSPLCLETSGVEVTAGSPDNRIVLMSTSMVATQSFFVLACLAIALGLLVLAARYLALRDQSESGA